MSENIFEKYKPEVDIQSIKNEELDGLEDRVDKIQGSGEIIDVNAYKIYKSTYDINVFVENDSDEYIRLDDVQCVFLAKTDNVAKIMSMNELCKQSQYEFVAIRDAILKSIVCASEGDRVVIDAKINNTNSPNN